MITYACGSGGFISIPDTIQKKDVPKKKDTVIIRRSNDNAHDVAPKETAQNSE